MNSNIKQVRTVIVCRPRLPQDDRFAQQGFLEIKPDQASNANNNGLGKHQIVIPQPDGSTKVHTPNCVFSPEAIPNDQLCPLEIESLLQGTLNGISAAVIAYGQTSSGKSYTMGTEAVVDQHRSNSVAYYVSHRLFQLAREKGLHDLSVSCFMVEVYKEGGNKEYMYDLLQGYSHPRVPAVPTDDSSCWKSVNSPEDLLDQISAGSRLRNTDRTDGNVRSSRSHAVVGIRLQHRSPQPDGSLALTTGRMLLADLAGSEKATAAEHGSVLRKQGAGINVGLLHLGRIITQVATDGVCKSYRDSALTMLLKPALSGKTSGGCNTLMIGCISPCLAHIDRTKDTLDFMHKAGMISNVVEPSVESLDSRRVNTLKAERDKYKNTCEGLAQQNRHLQGQLEALLRMQQSGHASTLNRALSEASALTTSPETTGTAVPQEEGQGPLSAPAPEVVVLSVEEHAALLSDLREAKDKADSLEVMLKIADRQHTELVDELERLQLEQEEQQESRNRAVEEQQEEQSLREELVLQDQAPSVNTALAYSSLEGMNPIPIDQLEAGASPLEDLATPASRAAAAGDGGMRSSGSKLTPTPTSIRAARMSLSATAAAIATPILSAARDADAERAAGGIGQELAQLLRSDLLEADDILLDPEQSHFTADAYQMLKGMVEKKLETGKSDLDAPLSPATIAELASISQHNLLRALRCRDVESSILRFVLWTYDSYLGSSLDELHVAQDTLHTTRGVLQEVEQQLKQAAEEKINYMRMAIAYQDAFDRSQDQLSHEVARHQAPSHTSPGSSASSSKAHGLFSRITGGHTSPPAPASTPHGGTWLASSPPPPPDGAVAGTAGTAGDTINGSRSTATMPVARSESRSSQNSQLRHQDQRHQLRPSDNKAPGGGGGGGCSTPGTSPSVLAGTSIAALGAFLRSAGNSLRFGSGGSTPAASTTPSPQLSPSKPKSPSNVSATTTRKQSARSLVLESEEQPQEEEELVGLPLSPVSSLSAMGMTPAQEGVGVISDGNEIEQSRCIEDVESPAADVDNPVDHPHVTTPNTLTENGGLDVVLTDNDLLEYEDEDNEQEESHVARVEINQEVQEVFQGPVNTTAIRNTRKAQLTEDFVQKNQHWKPFQQQQEGRQGEEEGGTGFSLKRTTRRGRK